jgi:uncharacterized membrane protein
MVTFGSRWVCALTLSLIALADISIILDIPVFRQVLGFILLTFVPGFLLIQLLQLTKNQLEKALLLIGLSISFLIFVPLVMNFVYPILGISRPISLFPLAATLSLILAGLSIFAYQKGALDFQITESDFRALIDRIRSPLALGALVILLLGILGGLFTRFYLDSILSLLSMLSIAVVVILLVISRRDSERFYPLYIFVIALALLYSRTLASPNLFGADIFSELYVADLVKASAIWNPGFLLSAVSVSGYYAMLSVAILPNVYSILLNADNVWVFKLIIPFIVAFVPVGLYQLWKTQVKISGKSAFLAAFFFISFSQFFDETIVRQQVAELFLVLALLLLLSSHFRGSRAIAVLVVFIASLAVSHYSTSYVFVFFLVLILIASALVRVRNRQAQETAVTATLVALAIAITFGWYMFASGGAPYTQLLDVGTHTVNTFGNELFAVGTTSTVASGLAVGIAYASFAHVIEHYWILLTLFLETAGLTVLIWRRKDLGIHMQFLVLSLASFFLMLFAVAVPAFAAALNGDRLYALTLFFLAPCCVFGIEAIIDGLGSQIRARKDLLLKLKCAAVLAVLVPYFLFMSGFIFEITEHPSNYAFLPSQNQSERTLQYSFPGGRDWSYLVQSPTPNESVYAARWLSSSMSPLTVYTDSSWASGPLVGYGNISPDSIGSINPSALTQSYVYLGPANVQSGNILLGGLSYPFSSYPTLSAGNRVYDNGLAEVYYYT